ncbi:MAG: hypothetical protein HUJ73_03275 [Eubacterium sp.]|nr:hypothetical protein [Eubacterium sp.]
MEIERKWIVRGWPDTNLPLLEEQFMQQGYISVEPTVRIREEALLFSSEAELPETCPETISPSCRKNTQFILCFKSKAYSGNLVRREIEFPVSESIFRDLAELTGHPLVPKTRRTYLLPDGYHLEVNAVEPDAATGFLYAEIEFPDERSAREWRPEGSLADYLSREVTSLPGYSMGAYWERTRLNKK